MAEIVLGMWTTHGPTLSTTPEEWLLRLPADHENTAHPFRGNTYDFDSLVELRRDEDDFAAKSSLEERTARHARCRSAIDTMADIFEETKPDVAVIFGNDQSEVFTASMMPTFTILNGEMIWNAPATDEQAALHPPGIHAAEWGHKPPEYTEYPAHPVLANQLISALSKSDFDVARANELPQVENHWHSGIGHAFGFVFRQIMRDKTIPTVPIIANTFFPPNQPSAKRCYDFGRVVGEAISNWESDARVAVFGSGGMSHFVIDEDLDGLFIQAIAERDWQSLTALDDELLQSGTSELKNWIGAAGALFPTKLSGGLVDYVPCYRSPAGTGTANGFIYWK
jgi:OH-DDVA oxygenase/3-O-methylgallate 3,4-dioxygenase